MWSDNYVYALCLCVSEDFASLSLYILVQSVARLECCNPSMPDPSSGSQELTQTECPMISIEEDRFKADQPTPQSKANAQPFHTTNFSEADCCPILEGEPSGDCFFRLRSNPTCCRKVLGDHAPHRAKKRQWANRRGWIGLWSRLNSYTSAQWVNEFGTRYILTLFCSSVTLCNQFHKEYLFHWDLGFWCFNVLSCA